MKPALGLCAARTTKPRIRARHSTQTRFILTCRRATVLSEAELRCLRNWFFRDSLAPLQEPTTLCTTRQPWASVTSFPGRKESTVCDLAAISKLSDGHGSDPGSVTESWLSKPSVISSLGCRAHAARRFC